MPILESQRAMLADERKLLGTIARAGLVARWFDRVTGFDRSPYARDQAGEAVRVLQVAATRGGWFRENLSEGPKIVLQTGPQQCLGLFGSWLLDPNVAIGLDHAFSSDEPVEFPGDLRIDLAPHSGLVLRLEAMWARKADIAYCFPQKLFGPLAPVMVIPTEFEAVPAYFESRGLVGER